MFYIDLFPILNLDKNSIKQLRVLFTFAKTYLRIILCWVYLEWFAVGLKVAHVAAWQ